MSLKSFCFCNYQWICISVFASGFYNSWPSILQSSNFLLIGLLIYLNSFIFLSSFHVPVFTDLRLIFLRFECVSLVCGVWPWWCTRIESYSLSIFCCVRVDLRYRVRFRSSFEVVAIGLLLVIAPPLIWVSQVLFLPRFKSCRLKSICWLERMFRAREVACVVRLARVSTEPVSRKRLERRKLKEKLSFAY